MIDTQQVKLWAMRGVFVLIALAIMFFHLLPTDAIPDRWAGPDLLVCLIFAWAVRRPEYVPMLLVVAVMLLADLMLQRPPGLWAALVLAASEWLKSRDRRQRETTFALEWLTFAGVLIVITAIYRAVLFALILSPGALYLSVVQVLASIAAYPVVVGISRFVFGIRRAAPGDIDRMGRKT